MKRLEVELLDKYKSYQTCKYSFEGDLIVLSGINGSGKSQLLKIIANSNNEKISRAVKMIDDAGNKKPVENILLLSFRDNINFGNDFGPYSISYRQNNIENAWNFYINNLGFDPARPWLNDQKIKKYNDGTLIFYDNGIKNQSWRSIQKLLAILKKNYDNQNIFHITKDQFEHIIPNDFIWRNENDIIQQVGNLFYIACCQRADKQIECSKTAEIFDNSKWLETAPWTILNKLFVELGFKYRFKNDYSFSTPNMEENPKLRMDNEIRTLNDLSDGEKAILKLALVSLDEEISKDLKLVLFDEYDAPLNPSLTESFYKVIDEFYIRKGIQVIVTTHSPATISLAPDYAQFYEIFNQNNTHKIIKVNKFDYAELREANQSFYDKIKDQEMRINELEKSKSQHGNCLLVEDKYDQIYKIAYLKLKDINNINKDNLDSLFSANANFSIHGNYSSGGLFNVLSCQNTTENADCKKICLFDFDQEGYGKYEKVQNLKIDKQKQYSPINNSCIHSGLYLKHKNCNRYAMMIPIPERLKNYVSISTSSDCFIEIESLIDSEFLKNNNKAERRSEVLSFYKLKDKHKCDFWEDLLEADKKIFKDFKPLFDTIESILNS